MIATSQISGITFSGIFIKKPDVTLGFLNEFSSNFVYLIIFFITFMSVNFVVYINFLFGKIYLYYHESAFLKILVQNYSRTRFCFVFFYNIVFVVHFFKYNFVEEKNA